MMHHPGSPRMECGALGLRTSNFKTGKVSSLVVRILGFHYHGPGSIPGWGTEVSQDTWHGQNK